MRFVEAGPRAGRFVEACYIIGPWLSNCVLENPRTIRFLG